MALVNNRWQRISMLCSMYFAQGVPWGFMTVALISYLAQQGVNDAEAGKLTAIVLIPWTFKLIWAPLIDTVTVPYMGRRRPWIIGSQLMMALSLLGFLMMGDLSENLRLLGWMFFLHNCFASFQDVSTDALAVDILPISEHGQTNGLMWTSKMIGRGVGASVMAMVIDGWGLSAAVLVQFIILLLIMIFPILILERPGEKRFPWSKSKVLNKRTVLTSPKLTEVLHSLYVSFSTISASVFLLFVTIKTIGWGIVEIITKTLYIQQLGWSFVEVSNVAGASVICEITGALTGGLLADRFGRRKTMVIGLGGYGLLHIIFGALPNLWQENWFAGTYLFLNPGFLAMGSVGFLSMSMKISRTKVAATMFTIYMTSSNIGHVLGNWLVGVLRVQLSYEHTFWAAGIITLVPLLLLIVVRPQKN